MNPVGAEVGLRVQVWEGFWAARLTASVARYDGMIGMMASVWFWGISGGIL